MKRLRITYHLQPFGCRRVVSGQRHSIVKHAAGLGKRIQRAVLRLPLVQPNLPAHFDDNNKKEKKKKKKKKKKQKKKRGGVY